MLKSGLKWLLLIALISPAWASDHKEVSPTGNILFDKAKELNIADQTLTIADTEDNPQEEQQVKIDVNTHIRNNSEHTVTRTIRFALPPVLCREDIPSSWSGFDPSEEQDSQGDSFKDFGVTVDDKTQHFKTRKVAMLGQDDITELLTKLKIPLNPCKIEMNDDDKPISKYAAKLEENHLLTEKNEPAWSEYIYYEWSQTFPADKVTNIHYHYTTVSAEAAIQANSLYQLNDNFTSKTPPLSPIWNRSPETLSKSNPSIIRTREGTKHFCSMPTSVRYNLLSANNWNANIGDFKLIIKNDQGVPFAVNKFYKNASRVSTTTDDNSMVFAIRNFTPSENLFIQFLWLPDSAEDLEKCS